MTLPPVVRVFFAIELSSELREELGHYISSLKKKSKSQSIRWTRADNLHITLQFLAEAKTEHLPALLAAVRQEVKGLMKEVVFQFGNLHVFPNPYRPRVIVLDIAGQDQLANISTAIGRGIQSMNYPIDERPFRAHLTLGRIKQPQGVDLHFLSSHEPAPSHDVIIKEVALFRSEPQPEGSLYTVLERIPL